MKLDGVRQKVFLDRYALKGAKGELLEKTPEEMWRRVARGIAKNERRQSRKYWEQRFYNVMKDFKFVPGGRILSGAGTNYQVTYFNCFVIPSPKDSRDGILESLKQLVEIQARSGGVGLNLSSLRPKGARVKKVNGTSSGPVNWAELFSVATHDIVQQGGCFAGDSLIMTHKGLVPIADIVSSKSNWYVFTHNGHQKVTAKFDNGTKMLFEVKTRAGYKVKVTSEHRFVTVDANGHFYLKRLADFKIGDTMVMLLGEWREDIPYVDLNTTLPKPSKYSFGRLQIDLPKELDENLAFIIGVHDADGSKIRDEYSPNGKGLRIAVAANRQKNLERLREAVRKAFGVNPTISRGDGAVYNLHIFSREVNEFLTINGLLKQLSISVSVPKLIFSSPRSVVEAYIAGVFLGDGSNRGGKGGLRISTVSEQFASQLQLLLLNLGVAAKIKEQVRHQKNWRTLYTVTVNGNRFMKRFSQLLSPYNEKLYDHVISKRDATFNWPFNLTEKFLYLSGFQRTIARANPTTSHKAVLFLEQRIPKVLEEDRSDIEILASCVADKVVSIKKIGEETVYDLEVGKVHLLSGNGFYTSNSRRGATMLMLWDWHPDIEEFITVKQDLSKINGANLSVCISDSFMEAVKKDKDWDLVYPDLDDPRYDKKWNGEIDLWRKIGGKVMVYKKIKARYLWDLICTAAWRSAEPGLHFLERSNKRSNTYYFEKLIATNPCGEQCLGAWAVCNLGAMNLSYYVKNGEFDYKNFGVDVRVALRFLDNVIDQTYYFFAENEKCAKEIRRTGLGIMGLGDALIKMKIRYGSDESLGVIEKIFQTLRDNAYEASSDLASEKGAFPKFDKKKYLKGYHIQALPKRLQKKIAKQGIRNAVLLTIAPTGTTSLVAGVTSGIEPVYEFTFVRKDRTGTHTMYHPLFEQWKKNNPNAKKPNYFVSANDLLPLEHARVQAVAQKYIDSSISKTVNAPNAHTVEDVKTLYMAAYDLGLKGVTYMREGSREGVLSRVSDAKKEEAGANSVLLKKPVIPRPMHLEGVTYQIDTPVGKTYVTLNHNENKEPFEVFITIGKSGSDVAAMADALGRMVSLNLRLSGALSPKERIRQVVAQLAGIGGARSVGFGKDKVRSLPDGVAKVLSMHYGFAINGRVEDKKKLSIKEDGGNGELKHDVVKLQQLAIEGGTSGVVSEDPPTGLYDICPECGVGSLAYEEGCRKCYGCGYAEC